MSSSIFTYGSLMFAEVWQKVVAGQYASAKATFYGYQRFALRGETYPGIVARATGSVDGLVYLDVSDADIAALDAFEGVDYRRIEAGVTSADGTPVAVQTYLMLQPQQLSDQPWLPEQFALQRFLDTYCRDHFNDQAAAAKQPLE
ncbi:MAG: gamma-glutamylcyclotransferase [Pseudomonadota bacterium]|nr:gamma-glutamylcyclotransferase [Pseudomonadota bacterium]